MKRTYRIFLISALIISLLVSGCRSKSSDNSQKSGAYYAEESLAYDYYEDGIMDMEYAADNSAASYSKAVPAAANSNTSEQRRMIQKSASINIQVMDPIDAAKKISDLTENLGGFVVSSSSSQEYYSADVYLPRANLTIRVPAESLNDTIAFIENLTTDTAKYVSNKRIYGVDITSDYVDTNSRLTSLEKTRDKLYEIMDTAENAEEALEVYNRIADVESDIEVYKGQIKYMEESVALSSVDVVITSIRPAPIQTVSSWNIGDVIKDAFESLLDGGKTVVEFVIYFIIVVIPILILVAIPVVLIVILIRKLINKKKRDSSVKSQSTGKNDSADSLTVEKKD